MTKNEKTRAWYQANKEHALAYAKAYRQKLGKDKIRQNNLEYRRKHPDIMKRATASWRSRNLERVRASIKTWEGKNIERKRELRRESQERNKHKPEYKITKVVRGVTGRIKTLTGKRADSVSRFLGASPAFVKSYIQARFKPGMTWDNHGSVWHFDHVIPLNHFDLTNKSQLKKAAHYTNLQPMFKSENMRKGDSLPEIQMLLITE